MRLCSCQDLCNIWKLDMVIIRPSDRSKQIYCSKNLIYSLNQASHDKMYQFTIFVSTGNSTAYVLYMVSYTTFFHHFLVQFNCFIMICTSADHTLSITLNENIKHKNSASICYSFVEKFNINFPLQHDKSLTDLHPWFFSV